MGTERPSARNKSSKGNELYILADPIDTSEKIVIDIEQITDFCFCPEYYQLKNQNSDEINFKALYDKSLHNTFYAYLRSLQNDTLVHTLEFLKYIWGKEWIKYKTTKDILITPSAFKRDNYELKRKNGIDAIYAFDEIMLAEKQCPIIIGHKYEYEILPNVVLTGTFEYVREITINAGNKIIQLVKFLSETNNYDTMMQKRHDLQLIAASYVFSKLFNVNYFQSIIIDVMKKKSIVNHFTDKDYKLLLRTIHDTIICIQNNINCISPSRHCFHCEYRNICDSTI